MAIESEISIVVYHHVSREDDPLVRHLGVRTDPEIFDIHVRYCAQHYDLIAASDLRAGKLPRRPLLITFDDAYRSVLDTACPILKSVSAPSVFFLNPATLEGASLPIDNLLSAAAEALGLPAVARALEAPGAEATSVNEILATVVSRMTTAEVLAKKERLCAAMGTTEQDLRRSSSLFLDLTDLKALTAYPIEVANHTATHAFLRKKTKDELAEEIGGSRVRLERMTGRPVQYFSVPYGDLRDATQDTLDAARSSGHKGIFLVHARSNRFRPAPDVYYRISPKNAKLTRLARELFAMPLLRSGATWLRQGLSF